MLLTSARKVHCAHILDGGRAGDVRLAVEGGVVPGVDGRDPHAAHLRRLGAHARRLAQLPQHRQLACMPGAQQGSPYV